MPQPFWAMVVKSRILLALDQRFRASFPLLFSLNRYPDLDGVLPMAFVVGLLSSFHCIGMCGGIMGALTFSLPVRIRSNNRQSLPFLLSYNLGRVISYIVAGALFGLFGAGMLELFSPWVGQGGPQQLAAVVMIVIGLNIAGWLPQLNLIERIGVPMWHRLEPFGRALLPVTTLPRALVYGIVWGWLPCGLVYTMLIAAAGQGSPMTGAMMMLAFGLGTLPSVILTGLLAGRMQMMANRPGFRVFAGGSVAAVGVVVLIYPAVLDGYFSSGIIAANP